MPSNKFKRDFYDYGALKRPGRMDRDLFQYMEDCGDGYGGILWMIYKAFGSLLLPKFAIEGCAYNGVDTLTHGYIMYNGDPIQVFQQAIVVGNGEWLYIDHQGNAHTTAVEATAQAGVVIYERDGAGVGWDVRFRVVNNILRVLSITVQDLIVNQNANVTGNVNVAGDLDVNGTANLDDTDIDGTLDVADITDLHDTLDMNNQDIQKVKDLDVDGNCDIEGNVDIDGTTDLHNTLNMHSNDIDNIKDIDGNIFFCSNEAEINAAITAIGVNGGTIIIKSGIKTLTGTIAINGGGSYIIRGQGNDTIIDCNGDRCAFTITSAEVCYIKKLKIDCSDFTGAPLNGAIDVNEGSNNKVSIENVKIVGDGSNGNGIYVQSANVDIKYCDISNVAYGIKTVAGSNYLKLVGNLIHDNSGYGLYIEESDYIRILFNIIYASDGHSGISILSVDHGVISLNDISDSHWHGIMVQSSNDCVVGGNTIHDINIDNVQSCAGIYLTNSDRININGNSVHNITNIGAGSGRGIYISNATCDECSVISNICQGCDVSYTDSGTNTFDSTATDGDPLNNF